MRTLLKYFIVALATFWSAVGSNVDAAPIVKELKFEPSAVQVGGSLTARFAGTDLTDDVYLDVRFRAPGGTSDQVALNWQQGTSASHAIAAGTGLGNWLVNGVRAYQNRDEHSGAFDAVAANLAIVSTTCFITTSAGSIQGLDLGESCAFLGIPYSAAPLGNLRWNRRSRVRLGALRFFSPCHLLRCAAPRAPKTA